MKNALAALSAAALLSACASYDRADDRRMDPVSIGDLERSSGAPSFVSDRFEPMTPQLRRPAHELLGIPAPDARTGQMIRVNGADLFVRESGAGEPILLLHGYPLSGALFERVRGQLESEYRVITIDQRGYGKSSSPGMASSVQTYANDALAVMDRLGLDSAWIGGMSMGGPVMFEMYRQRPDVFRGLIAINTNHKPANAIEKGIWSGTQTALRESGSVDSIIPFLLPNMLTGDTRRVNGPAQPAYLEAAMKQASMDGAMGGAMALANRPDASGVVRSLRVPMLVMVGREDTLYPVAISKEMADLSPRATLKVIGGASHAAIFERPAASATLIADFIEGNSR